MIHQAGRFLIIVEVEQDAMESIFYYLKDNNYNNVFLQPDEKVMSQYVFHDVETIIVKALVSKSPVQKTKTVVVPRLEKILVDIFCEEILLRSFNGELENILNTAYEKIDLNFSTLLTYASRRGKKKELVEYMKANTTIPENLFT